MYNYYDDVIDDVKNYIVDNEEYLESTSLEALEEELNEKCWNSDSVTGNASGSYTFNAYKAEENLNGNWSLLQEALEEFGYSDVNPIKKGPEWCDIIIRLYLLPQAISEALKQVDKNELEKIFSRND